MKFFHLSDLHIGLKLLGKDLQEDQTYIFEQIAACARKEQPDAILIAGDIYDKAVPSAEAVELFDRLICMLKEAAPETELMMISGNHDSAARLNVFRDVLGKQKIHMIGQPPQLPGEQIEKVTLEDSWGPVVFYLLPFVKPSMVKNILGTDENGNNLSYNETLHRLIGAELLDDSVRNVLVSHQFYVPGGLAPEEVERADSEIRTVGNIDEVQAGILQRFDYAALGHIHRPMMAGDEFHRYCGTPIPCSVSEAGQKKGIVMVELGPKGDRKTTVLPLHPLHEVRVVKGAAQEVLAEACTDYVTVVLTDTGEEALSDLQDMIHAAFPNLLEIRREMPGRAELQESAQEAAPDPFELCCSFYPGMDETEQQVIRDVINHIKEGC